MRKTTDLIGNEGHRVYARLVSHVSREIVRALNSESDRFNRSSLADAIGRDRSFITRKLSGSENMELRTIAAILGVLGYELDVKAKRINGTKNQGRSSNMPPPSRPEQSNKNVGNTTVSAKASINQIVPLGVVGA